MTQRILVDVDVEQVSGSWSKHRRIPFPIKIPFNSFNSADQISSLLSDLWLKCFLGCTDVSNI